MKKVLILTIMIMTFGCSEELPQENVLKYKNGTPSIYDDVTHLSYKDHDYLKFGRGNGQWGVHDPDCKNSIHKQ